MWFYKKASVVNTSWNMKKYCRSREGIWCITDWTFKSISLSPTWFFLAKLQACGFNNKSLKVVQSYLSKIWKEFRTWQEIFSGVPQSSMLGPMLYLCDLFIIMSDIDTENFAYDNKSYMSAENTKSFVKSLESLNVGFLLSH